MTTDASAVRYARDDEGIVTVTFDQPGAEVNTMNTDYVRAMGEVVDRLEAERNDVRGVVLTSAKQTFFAGGDLALLRQVTAANVGEFTSGFRAISDQLRRLERVGTPVVAVLDGAALGGGCEIALAAHRRIAVDDSDVRIGLPEVTLGLLPGSGGVSRLVRLLGLQAALPLLLQGRRLTAHEAHGAGLVDELAGSSIDAHAAAVDWIRSGPQAIQPWDREGVSTGVPDVRFGDPQAYLAMSAAPAMLHQQTRGAVQAPQKLLTAAVEGAFVDIDTALQIDHRYFLQLLVGTEAKNLIDTLWFQLNEIGAGASRPHAQLQRQTTRVAVIGAGMMGSGIAYVAAYHGVEVVLKDRTEAEAVGGRDRCAQLLDERVGTGRLRPDQREQILARIHPAGGELDLEGCDLVIEAVFEDRALKNQVLADAEAAVADGAVLASNTSTLPITGLAGAVQAPGRFVGLHFFSPVHKMPLVEIIRGEQTTQQTLARAFDFVRQIDKTPIVVGDGRGFFTSRVFGAYVREGVRLLVEGVPPALIENLARQAGMPVGPLAVADEVSLGLLASVRRQELADAARVGQSVTDDPAYAVIETMVDELGRTGRAGGAGFYEYTEDGDKRLWQELRPRFAADSADVDERDVIDRLLFAQVLETARCRVEGVVDSDRDANIGSIFGWGFPAAAGGAAGFVEAYGAERFAARAQELTKKYGERFTPPR